MDDQFVECQCVVRNPQRLPPTHQPLSNQSILFDLACLGAVGAGVVVFTVRESGTGTIAAKTLFPSGKPIALQWS